jgi:hypothetical protein
MAPGDEALARANEVVAAYGASIRSFFQAEKRDELTSVLFDVPRRSLLGWHCLYRHAPEFFAELWAQTTPEEFGRRMARPGTRPYQLQLAILALGFLAARQHLLMDRGLAMGDPLPGEDVDRTVEFVLNLERMQRSYRIDGTLVPDETGFTTRILAAADLERVAARLEPTDPERYQPIRQAVAKLQMFAFLFHGEQRDGVFGHGPYDVNGATVFFREINDLQNNYVPWALDEPRSPVPNVVVAYQVDDVRVTCDVFGSLVADPHDFADRLEAVAILTAGAGDLRPLDGEEVEAVQQAAALGTRKLFGTMARWDDEYKLRYGGPLFANHMKTFFDLQGIDGTIGDRLMDTFEESAKELCAGILQRDTTAVWKHMARGATDCFWPVVR